jgi:hypothetical protein
MDIGTSGVKSVIPEPRSGRQEWRENRINRF